MQTRGSIAENNVRSLLEAAQAERATGTLTLRHNGSGATTLYFLFGHLFHAQGEQDAGDEAVVTALAWHEGDFDFDAKAKLPADETVRSSIPELIERSGSNGSQPTPAPAPQPAPAPPKTSTATRRVAPAPQPAPEAWTPPPDSPSSTNNATVRISPPSAAAAAAPPPPQAPARVAPAAEAPQDATARTQVTPPAWRRFFKQKPKPRHGREPVPVPAGQTMYDSLKTSFVDFPRLITTLEREGHTGYVRLLTEEASGLIYFRDGSVLECAYDAGEGPQPEFGKPAFLHYSEEVARGQGVLDVVGLSPELVDGLVEITRAHPIYTELYTSWVDVPALLRFLEERRLSGAVTVRATTGTGVIILNEGKLAGAFTSESREPVERADSVLALCHDPNAMIEVRAQAEVRHEPLDVADVIGNRRAVAYQAPAPAPAPAPIPTPAPIPSSGPVTTAVPRAQPQPQPAYAPQAPVYSPPPAQAVAPQAPAYIPPAAAAQPVPAPPPAYVTPAPAAPVPSGAEGWEGVIADLQQITEDQLGNRARKVKDLLGAAERSRAGIQSAIDQIPTISILFVDASRLEALANELRARLEAYPG